MRFDSGCPLTRYNFEDRYGSTCSVQASSLAEESCIWLGVDKSFEGTEQVRMHLSVDQVRALLPLLQTFAETGLLPKGDT